MYKEILTDKQLELLPLIKDFSKRFYLVRGTAIALQIGHRRSIDFDLFTDKDIKRKNIINVIEKHEYATNEIIHQAHEQFHINLNSVKVTFFSFPHKIKANISFEGIINVPDLLDLSAMKAYALGGRAKWKDYVDLYFMLKDHLSLKDISIRAKELFTTFFNEKLFRQQLCYFNDINYSEKVVFMSGYKVKEIEIKKYLTKIATTAF